MKLTYRNHKVRPRIQRAFLAWLSANRHRLAVPIRITKRTDKRIEWSFVGVNPRVYGYLAWEIAIAVNWKGRDWDHLRCFEALPKRSAGGVFCTLCDLEARKVFASREALWLDHLFEPFLEWVNERLYDARWICIYGPWAEGWTSATLIEEFQHLPGYERLYGCKGTLVPLFLDRRRGPTVHEFPRLESSPE